MCSFDELQVIESTAATSLPTANQHIKATARHCCSENDAFPSEMSFWRYFWNHTKAQQGCPLKQAACENVEKGICDHIIALAAAAPCRTAEIQTAARKQSKPNEPIHVLDNPGAGGGVVMLYSLTVPVESDKESSAEGDSSDENDDEEAYEVRAVTDTRRDADGEEEFRVLWENYPDGDYSWEPRENFLGCSAKKILAAFEQRNEKRKRPGQVASGSKRFKLLCGMKVVLDPDRDDDEPNWLRGGLDKKYKEKNVCVEHDGTKYNGTVDQYAFSVAAGETNVPAVFQIQYEGTAPGDIQVLNRMDVERAMTLHSREQRGKRSRRN